MRKKAYVQQLETSRLKLAQLKLELERARQQGLYMLGSNANMRLLRTINPGIAAFEMEYNHWIEEQQKKNAEYFAVSCKRNGASVAGRKCLKPLFQSIPNES